MPATITTVPDTFNVSPFYQGAPINVNIVPNPPINMTGGTILLKIRSTQADTGNTLILTPTTTWIDITTGQFNISITSAQTQAFSFPVAYWDCFFVDASSNYNPLFYGQLGEEADVSY